VSKVSFFFQLLREKAPNINVNLLLQDSIVVHWVDILTFQAF